MLEVLNGQCMANVWPVYGRITDTNPSAFHVLRLALDIMLKRFHGIPSFDDGLDNKNNYRFLHNDIFVSWRRLHFPGGGVISLLWSV